MKSRLRTPAEGADTVVWLSSVNKKKLSNGSFYLDRQEAGKHLPMAWTHSDAKENEQLMKMLDSDLMKPSA